jgi:hypothetical protein
VFVSVSIFDIKLGLEGSFTRKSDFALSLQVKKRKKVLL